MEEKKNGWVVEEPTKQVDTKKTEEQDIINILDRYINRDLVFLKLLEKVKQGDSKMISLYMTYVYGKPTQTELLNEMFPWLESSRELIEEETEFIKKITSINKLESSEVNYLFNLYNIIFSSKLQRCNCTGLIQKMIQRLGVIEEYRKLLK